MSTAIDSSSPSAHAVRLPPAIPDVPIYRFTVKQYHQLADAGILDENSGVELMEGWVLMRNPPPKLCAEDDAIDVESRDPEIPAWPAYRFSVDDYHAMADAGILEEGAPIELLEGWLVPKMTKNPPHEFALTTLWHLFNQMLPGTHLMRGQSPITCGTSEPEPVISIVRGSPRNYVDQHPFPADVALVVEVAEASLKSARTTKKRTYAEASIIEYWIVNLIDRQIEVYTQPTGPKKPPVYAQRQDYQSGQSVPFIIAGEKVGEIAVNDVLP